MKGKEYKNYNIVFFFFFFNSIVTTVRMDLSSDFLSEKRTNYSTKLQDSWQNTTLSYFKNFKGC